jgi:hypothetical protein
MIITRLLGGLGNQMFQYACARKLAAQWKTGVCFDLSALLDEELSVLHTPRYYELGCFHFPQKFATEADLERFGRARKFFPRLGRHLRPFRVLQERSLAFESGLMKRAVKQTRLIGYWQSEKYFRGIEKELREDFQLHPFYSEQAAEKAKIIPARETVSVHVRRGDYAGDAKVRDYHGECGVAYYEKAMRRFVSGVQKPVFVIFSDDPDWCRRNLPVLGEYVYMEPSFFPAIDMILMSACAHHIIANSSFSWWGAWLNPNPGKIVIAPKPWNSGTGSGRPDIIPAGWLEMDK